MLRFNVQRGVVVIPKSFNPTHVRKNFEVCFRKAKIRAHTCTVMHSEWRCVTNTADLRLLSFWWRDDGHWRVEQEHSICGAPHVSLTRTSPCPQLIVVTNIYYFLYFPPTGGRTIQSIHFIMSSSHPNIFLNTWNVFTLLEINWKHKHFCNLFLFFPFVFFLWLLCFMDCIVFHGALVLKLVTILLIPYHIRVLSHLLTVYRVSSFLEETFLNTEDS